MHDLGRRAVHLGSVLLVVTFLSFAVIDLLPGDAAVAVAGNSATADDIERVRSELGLDRVMPVRYVEWLGDAVQGDLGRSFLTGQSVADALTQRVPVSVLITSYAQILAFLIAVPLAMYSAYRPGRLVDRMSMTASFGAAAMPPFILAMVLIVLFAGGVSSVLPATGYIGPTESLTGHVRTVILPAFTLAVPLAAVYRQLLRSDMVSTLQEDYILMARSKGLSTRKILVRHALRPSSFSLVTLAGVNMGTLISGAVITETIFAIPGLGQMLVQSVVNRDYMLLQGALLFTATAYVVINMGIDLAYRLLDPRTRQHA